jgi:hypothetical protein
VAKLHCFIVTWGRMGRPDFHAEEIDAFDPEEALAIGAERHPELFRPQAAVLASQAGPLRFGLKNAAGPDTTPSDG